jgi:hypothetical protein
VCHSNQILYLFNCYCCNPQGFFSTRGYAYFKSFESVSNLVNFFEKMLFKSDVLNKNLELFLYTCNDKKHAKISKDLDLKNFVGTFNTNLVKNSFIKRKFNDDSFILHASFNQGNINRLKSNSFGNQCSAICAVCLAYAFITEPKDWDCEILNNILVKGDCYYNELFTKLKKINLNQPEFLNVSEVLGKIQLNKNVLFLEYDPMYIAEDILVTPLNALFTLENVLIAFQYFANNFTSGLLIVNHYTYAIIYSGNTFYFFNSHSTSLNGLTIENGTASLLMFNEDNCAINISKFLLSLHPEDDESQFSLEPILLNYFVDGVIKRENSEFSNNIILPLPKKNVSIQKTVENSKLSRSLSTFSDLSIIANSKKQKRENIDDYFVDIWDRIYNDMQNLESFFAIKNLFSNNSVIIIKMINKFRKIKDSNMYNYQKTTSLYTNILEINKIDKIKIPIYTIGDGNCFYRAISNILFGNQDYFKIVKICVIFILIDYFDYFEILFRDFKMNIGISNYILKHSKNHVWTDDFITQATAILCKRSICVFALRQRQFYTIFNSCLTKLQNPICTLYSCDKTADTYVNGHFTALLDLVENSDIMLKYIEKKNSTYNYIEILDYNQVIFSHT